jgi:competence protein ComEA
MSAPPPFPKHPQLPLVLLAAAVLVLLAYRGYGPRFAARPSDHFPPASNTVDLNTADKTELLQIPGVGPSLANAILTHRQAVGRFDRVDDLTNVKGVGPKTLDKLRHWVRVGEEPDEPVASGRGTEPPVERLERKAASARPPSSGTTKKLEVGETVNVNAAPGGELQRLPGVGPALAGRIIAERERRPFAAAEDLRRVSGIGAKTLEKLRPFVVVK